MCGFGTFLLYYGEVLQNPVVKGARHHPAELDLGWSETINELLLPKQLNKDVKYFLTKHDIIKLLHHGFACDCRKNPQP